MDNVLIQAEVNVEDIACSLTEKLTLRELIKFVHLLDNYREDWDFTYGVIIEFCNIILTESKDALKERLDVQMIRQLEPTARDSEVINESSELIEIVENFLSALKLHHENHDTGIELQ